MAYTNVSQSGKTNTFGSMANPIVRKLEKKGEKAAENVCTYGGIVGKTVYFLIVTAIGVFFCFLLHNILLASAGSDAIQFADENGIFELTINPIESVLLVVVLAVSLIVPFLAWFIQKTIPVTGTIYCVAQGMLIGYITVALGADYKFLSVLAMLITLALVGAMLFVYAKGIIKVNAKFRGIITAIFFAIVIAGIIYFILSIIPGIRNTALFAGISQIMARPAVSIGVSIVFVIIAALFMLSDFDTIQSCVTYGLDKKYEWMAAWGLAYTVLYIYFKILRILIMIFGNRNSSSSSKSRSF